MRSSLAALLLGATQCGPPLSGTEAERVIRARIGENPTATCFWRDNLVQVDERRGRYISRHGGAGGEPAACFRLLTDAGVIANSNAFEFQLAPSSRFEQSDGRPVVVFACGMGAMGAVHQVYRRRDEGAVNFEFIRTSVDPRVRSMVNPASAMRACQIDAPAVINCQARLKHRDGHWVFERFREPLCRHLAP